MLLTLTLALLQPIVTPVGMWTYLNPEQELQPRCCLVASTSAAAQIYADKQEKLAALRKMLFRTPGPRLLSHDLPPLALDPPSPVSAPKVNDPALRQLEVQQTGFTPYDRYLGVVRNVMAELPSRKKSLSGTCRLMQTAHGFRYAPGDPYRADSPSVTATRKSGDCKAKALWLYDQLGDQSVLYVIGKVSRTAKASHAWLYWRWDNRWWILDPTNQNAPIAADSVATGRYVPYYSFASNATYRHPATHLLIAKAESNPASAVASKTAKRKRRR